MACSLAGAYRSARTRVGVALLAILCASGLFATRALATTPASGAGVNGWYLFWVLPQSQWNAQLTSMAADNVKVVRADAFWSSVEPTAPTSSGHHYNWTATDAIVGALARHGLQWLPIADYSTPWAESTPGNLKSPPNDVNSYAAFAAAVVARYGSNGSFWKANPSLTPEPVSAVEIWNEENLSGSYIAPAAYSQMYEAARSAIHAVDPSVEAVVGGLGNPADQYINQMYSTLGGAGKIDAVADHPYALTPAQTIGAVKQLRLALDNHGDTNVPIDMTEFGWPTQGYASWTVDQSDSQRAADLTQVINTLGNSDCGVERILPYSWVTAQSNTSDTGDWFGIANLNGIPDQSTAALASAYASLGGASTGSATQPVCGRPLTLRLAQVPATSASAGNLCVRATVLSWSSAGMASVGISHATVSFSSPAKVSVTTDSSGTATACWNAPRGVGETVAATAQQPNFYVRSTASVSAAATTNPPTTTTGPTTKPTTPTTTSSTKPTTGTTPSSGTKKTQRARTGHTKKRVVKHKRHRHRTHHHRRHRRKQHRR